MVASWPICGHVARRVDWRTCLLPMVLRRRKAASWPNRGGGGVGGQDTGIAKVISHRKTPVRITRPTLSNLRARSCDGALSEFSRTHCRGNENFFRERLFLPGGASGRGGASGIMMGWQKNEITNPKWCRQGGRIKAFQKGDHRFC
jgi:hypothetical protein